MTPMQQKRDRDIKSILSSQTPQLDKNTKADNFFDIKNDLLSGGKDIKNSFVPFIPQKTYGMDNFKTAGGMQGSIIDII